MHIYTYIRLYMYIYIHIYIFIHTYAYIYANRLACGWLAINAAGRAALGTSPMQA